MEKIPSFTRGGYMRKKIDRVMLVVFILLILYGILVQFSASGGKPFFKRHVFLLLLSIPVFLTGFFIRPRLLLFLSFPLYLGGMVLLIFPLIFSHGVKRWVSLGFFRFQPSEFMKVILIILLARLFAFGERKRLRAFLFPLVLSVLPFLLVAVEPDLGTSVVFILLFLGFLFFTGINVFQYFIYISPILAVLCAFHILSWIVFVLLFTVSAWFSKMRLREAVLLLFFNSLLGGSAPVLWNHLHDYQKKRILAFINPGLDPRGAGWHILQSKIAIGSGGISGKGYLQGTQHRLEFIPASHTDFVFSVIGEEFGFVGCILLLLLFFIFIYRIYSTGVSSRNPFYSFLSYGIAIYFLLHVFINTGMALGILPVVGLPLPFISYGGSFLLSCMFLSGLALNLSGRVYEY